MSMFNDISCDKKGNEEECLANAKVVSILAKKFGIGQWSFIGPGVCLPSLECFPPATSPCSKIDFTLKDHPFMIF